MTLDWKNISLNFTEKLQKEWENEGFNYNQTYDWINVGLKITEAKLATWLKNEEKQTPEEILNTSNLEDLYKKFEQYQKKNKPEQGEDPFIPDWLFEEPKKPQKPTKPLSKPPKTPKPHLKEKPWECRICEKNTFYSRQEFIKAHHGSKTQSEPYWVYKTIVIRKKPIITKQMWVCRICKQENHTLKCKYYSPPQQFIPPLEIFDWESYWKWWFGVFTLDWDSERFFG